MMYIFAVLYCGPLGIQKCFLQYENVLFFKQERDNLIEIILMIMTQ